MHLTDRFQRRISYLRLSVTDRCDFRCVYCMAEQMTFLPRREVLSLEELYQLGRAFVELGVTKIRLTGGEPLVRANVLSLVQSLADLDGLEQLALTTNGSRLAALARPLCEAGLTHLNISLDSLDPERFLALTRTGRLDDVLAGIDAALAAGFRRVKLNAVILRGRNDDEIAGLVAFARARGCDISFIEEMPLGQITEHDRAEAYMPSDEVRGIVHQHWPLLPSTEQTGGPSRYWRMGDSDTRVGFISPHSHNFCSSCNRVRVTVQGRLLLCLGNEHSVDLRAVMREHPGDRERLVAAIVAAMDLKPERHEFDLGDAPQILRFMNATGG